MLFIIGGELREKHFSKTITDEDWLEIEKLSGLPPQARSEIDEMIGYCRELRCDASRKYKDLWFDKLSAVMEVETASKKALDDMIGQPDFFKALAMGLDGQVQIPDKELQLIREWLKRTSKQKQRLLDWYREAQNRVHHFRTGQRTGRTALVELVTRLNEPLLHHTGKRISAGKTNLKFAVKVCTIAFPDLQKPYRKERRARSPYERAEHRIKYERAERKVKKAIEQFVNERANDEGLDRISNWQDLIPGWNLFPVWS